MWVGVHSLGIAPSIVIISSLYSVFDEISTEKILKKNFRYARLQDHIMKIREEINYQFIGSLLKKIYQELGGVHDLDENFDFERDPTEEELPKFVLEKDTKTEVCRNLSIAKTRNSN